ncbi:hypothetical protein AB1Y20_002927 [Prymnesium parvum]|uniref:Uncharacterized protein n=1 Tax=Prymnesium parvum TaxID=97485 RepID=A0AB34J9Z3_PRYPA
MDTRALARRVAGLAAELRSDIKDSLRWFSNPSNTKHPTHPLSVANLDTPPCTPVSNITASSSDAFP